MLNFGHIIGLFIWLALIGITAPGVLKTMEVKMAKGAIEAHKQGYISIAGFQKRLENGK